MGSYTGHGATGSVFIFGVKRVFLCESASLSGRIDALGEGAAGADVVRTAGTRYPGLPAALRAAWKFAGANS